MTMADRDTPFPEIGSNTNPNAVPWAESVVWSDSKASSGRTYEWIEAKDVRSVNWSAGVVSIGIHTGSYLDKHIQYIIINAPFVAIGKNVPMG
jgi:hypothetical protein